MFGSEANDHPALQKAGFNSTTTAVTSTAKSTLFGALKGALIGGLILGGAAFLGGAALLMLPGVGQLIAGAAWITGFAGTAVTAATMAGATWGGIAGGAYGLVNGVTNAENVVSERRDEIISDYERNAVRQQRAQVMAQRQQMQEMAMLQQQQQMGMGVGQGLPMGNKMGGPGVGM